jgi:alkylhydroperoxidase/carboxymuconolactone decarboxylase family protein YurZ
MLAGFNRQSKSDDPIRAAIEESGVNRSEVHEVLLHVLAYCGIPAVAEVF